MFRKEIEFYKIRITQKRKSLEAYEVTVTKRSAKKLMKQLNGTAFSCKQFVSLEKEDNYIEMIRVVSIEKLEILNTGEIYEPGRWR